MKLHNLNEEDISASFGLVLGCAPGLEYSVGGAIATFDNWTYGAKLTHSGTTTLLLNEPSPSGPGGFIDERAFQSPSFNVPAGCLYWGISCHIKFNIIDPDNSAFDGVILLTVFPNGGGSGIVNDGSGTGCLLDDNFSSSLNATDSGMLFHEIRNINPDCNESDLTLIHEFVPGDYTTLFVRGYYISDSITEFESEPLVEISEFTVFTAAGL